MAMTLKGTLVEALQSLEGLSKEELLDRRYARFRKIGVFEEGAVA
jgi:acetyl-CoA carboxylase carboxyl transferase subunit alpha